MGTKAPAGNGRGDEVNENSRLVHGAVQTVSVSFGK
jgi:hypothetical protein